MMQVKTMKKNVNRSKWLRQTLFAVAIVIVPLAWWAFTFFYTTFDTILLAFYNYDAYTQSTIPVGFQNFIDVISDLTTVGGLLNTSLWNSLLLWGINVFIAIPVALIVSFGLYKKIDGAGIYKIILFLPHIISGMVWVLIYKTLLDKGFRVDWLSNDHYNFGALLFYNLWLGFAGNMVLYTGAMGRVPPELVEAGHLDGMNDFQEFIHIVIPLIFPTLSVILTTCIVTIFSIQLPVFVFYDLHLATNKHHLYTFGLYTFLRGYGQDPRHTPLVSTISILVCLVAAPASVLFRRLLEKISPTVEY